MTPKYIGLDVHQATISVAVLDSAGKLVMEAVLETKAETILQFIQGLRGSLHVTLEEGRRTARCDACDQTHTWVEKIGLSARPILAAPFRF
jgi:hypothetical protein